jgi:hypothetical protein
MHDHGIDNQYRKSKNTDYLHACHRLSRGSPVFVEDMTSMSQRINRSQEEKAQPDREGAEDDADASPSPDV